MLNLWCHSPTCLEGAVVSLLESVLSDHETMTQSLDKHVNDSLLVNLISSILAINARIFFFLKMGLKFKTTLKICRLNLKINRFYSNIYSNKEIMLNKIVTY